MLGSVSIDSFWEDNGSINTLSFYKQWPDGYVNDGQRINRLSQSSSPNCAQANEIIAYGVGTLRPFRVEGKGLSSFLCETVRRVDSMRLRRLGTYIVDAPLGDPHALESTNIVMPEVIGELRQLADRKEEADFLDAYLRDMQATLAPVRFKNTTESEPRSLMQMRPRWREAHKLHLTTGIWNEPPKDTAEMVDRMEEVLERIVVDDSPVEKDASPEPSDELLALIDKF
jgi:hypothetical protein